MRAINYALAVAASNDAGNRNRNKHGRAVWSEEDYNAACAELNRLWPMERQIEESQKVFAAAKRAGIAVAL